jgi:hypothetical protein
MPKPAGRSTTAAVIPGTAITDQTAITAIAGSTRARRSVIGESVAQQHTRVRIICGAVTDEGPQDTARLPPADRRRGYR